ncbi:lytic polysaccharide monooxygenase, partial [Acidomyces richmondensis BFW]
MSTIQIAALLGSLAATVAGHGRVQGIVAGGIWYEGYNPSFQYENPAPVVIGWSDPEDLSNGFIDPSNYTTPEIICHLGATPAGTAAKVKAGSKVELQWTPWPESHHGPVLTYLAKCPASCSDVDKTTLKFFKIDEVGLISDATPPGIWAADQLEANNNSWVVEIPSSIASGNYVMRHEIIALHSAETENGAQNYPQCINLEITSSGTDNPEGTLGEELYTPDEPGILIDIYTSLSTYKIPGPTLYSGAVSLKQT